MASPSTAQNSASGSGTRGRGRGRGSSGVGSSRSSGPRRKNQANSNHRANGNGKSSNGSSVPAVVDLITSTAALAVAQADDDSGDCWICAEPVKFYAVAFCNHRTCHVCAVRLRALYKKTECTFCKHEQPKMIFTSSPSLLFEDYTLDMIPFADDKLGISFESNDMMQETLFLLRFNCPETECTFTGTGWADLKWHVRDMHGLLMCDLCIRNKKIFAHEHTLYQPKLYMQHLPHLRRVPIMPPQHQHRSKDPDHDKGKESNDTTGTDVPAIDFVHPICEFCHESFFGSDELYGHMRERHEECFVCRRMGTPAIYFQNYDKMNEHFQSQHYPCTHPSCLEQKFIVFSAAGELQMHQIEQHGDSMTVRERKEKSRVEAGFTFEEGRTLRGIRGAGPSSSRHAGFGGTLTSTHIEETPPVARDPHADVEYQTSDLAPLDDILRPLSVASQFTVISSVRGFRASERSAREMLDAVFNVHNRDLEVMGGVVAKILDVLETHSEKKAELLTAWNGMKVEERQHFPSLAPVAASSQQAGWAGIASGRVINIKKRTSQRPTSNHQTTRRVWDRVEQAATSSSTPSIAANYVPGSGRPPPRPATTVASTTLFPSLGTPSLTTTVAGQRKITAAAQRTPWTSSGQLTAPAPTPSPVPFSVNVPQSNTRASGAPATSSIQQFPSLGASSSARALPPREFISGNQSVKNIRGTAPVLAQGAWGASAASNEDYGDDNAAPTAATAVSKKKKGKEKLFTFGG